MAQSGPYDAAATTSALTDRADLIPGHADVLRLATNPVLETGERLRPDAHNRQASPARITVSESGSIWRTSCKGHWTAQRSATMSLELFLVWAAILGGLTFLAMAAD